MSKLEWTDAMDDKLRELRALGKPWDEVAEGVGVNPTYCMKRAKELGIPTTRTTDSLLLQARRQFRRQK